MKFALPKALEGVACALLLRLSFQSLARRLPTLLTMLALLSVESLSEADPKSTAKQDAKNGNNDAVGLGAAVFRVIETRTAVIDVFHERTR